MTHITARRVVVALDCPDARQLADFYATMLGWTVHSDAEYPDWVDVLPPTGSAGGPTGGLALGFQTVPDFLSPTWPEGPIPQQEHLDFYVDSIADAEPTVLDAGARRHEVQPSPDGRFVVYLDPVGHPFCLCTE